MVTAAPRLAAAGATFVMLGAVVAGGRPPVVVTRIIPFQPTAQPQVAFVKATPVRSSLLPEACAPQVEPPLAVARIEPQLPTAHACVESLQAIPLSHAIL